MNSLLNSDRDDDLEDDRPVRRDREITLGTTVVLGIFFALAAICAVFFGFGYSMGRRSAPAGTVAVNEPSNSAPFNAFKPAPGSPLGAGTAVKPLPAPTVTVPMSAAPSAEAVVKPLPAPRAIASDFTPPAAVLTPAAEPVRPSRVPAALPPPAPAAAVVSTAPAPPGQFMVQIAAVTHQEDADTLVTSIGRKGYNVAVHHEPQDKLLHIQIGPFPTRKDADAMRQRILADGFNAIVK